MVHDALEAVLGDDHRRRRSRARAGSLRRTRLRPPSDRAQTWARRARARRMRGQHRTDRDALLLSARKHAQRPIAEIGDAEEVESLLDSLPHHVGRQAELLHRVGKLLLDGVGDEAGERGPARRSPRRRPGRGACVAGVAAVDDDRPTRCPPVKWGTSPLTSPSSVDFPTPVAPTTRQSWPSSIERSRSRNTGRGPRPCARTTRCPCGSRPHLGQCALGTRCHNLRCPRATGVADDGPPRRRRDRCGESAGEDCEQWQQLEGRPLERLQ